MPRVRGEKRLAIALAGLPGAVLLRRELAGGGGSGRGHARIPRAAAPPSPDVAARATHARCPIAAARQITKPDSAVRAPPR